MVAVDWFQRGEYIAAKHQVTSEQANEALADPDRVVVDPDPASRSGVSTRTIGYCTSLATLVSVITVTEDDGTVFGINAWRSSTTDRRKYREGNEQ